MADKYGFDPLAVAPAPAQKERIVVAYTYERCVHANADIYIPHFGWARLIERRMGDSFIERR